MIPKFIRSIYYILFFAVPLIVIPTTSELFELNKMVFIYAGALLVFCFGAADVLMYGRQILRKTPLDIPIIVFLTVLMASLLFSIDRHTSFFGYYGRFNGGVLSILAFIVLYYGAVNYFRREHVINLLRVSVVSSVVVMLWGLSGKLGHDFSCLLFTHHFDNSCWTDQFRPAERMFSTLGQPNWLGAYLAAEFYIGVYLYITRQKKNVSVWYANIPYGIYLVVNFMCILFSRSRSALIGWLVGAIIFAGYFVIKKRRGELRPYASIAVACVLVAIVFKTGIAAVDKVITLPSGSSKKAAPAPRPGAGAPQLSSEVTESFDIRKIVWKGAWELGLRYPVLGTGPETFAYSYYFVRPQEHNMTSEWDYIYNKAHNEYLNYLATTGFTGLAAYLYFIGVSVFTICYFLFTNKYKNRGGAGPAQNELLSLALISSYATVLVTNFFGFSTSTTQLFFYLFPALAFVTFVSDKRVETNKTLGFWQYAGFVVTGIIAVVSLMWLVFFFAADLQYSEGNGLLSQGEYQQAASRYSNALTLHHEHIYEDRLSSSLANVALLAAYGEKPDTAKNFIMLSRYYIDRAISESPQNMLYWKTKGKNEYTFYQVNPDSAYIDEAIKALSQAYHLAPTDPKLPYTLGLLYGAMNQKRTSKEYIDKSIALKPDYQDAYILKLKLLRAWKDNTEADQFEKVILSKFPTLTTSSLEEQLK